MTSFFATLEIPWPITLQLAANAISSIEDPLMNVIPDSGLPSNINVKVSCSFYRKSPRMSLKVVRKQRLMQTVFSKPAARSPISRVSGVYWES